jgi:sporadic carbohydrate cluster 2OG-Fe(II) oxygenase
MISDFLECGYAIVPAEDREALDRIRLFIARQAAACLGESCAPDAGTYLDDAGKRLRPERVNDVRLAVIAAIEREAWFRDAYYRCGRAALDELVGNELAMQRSVGFSIQLPNDDSSLLPLHSDAWSEDSPFEAVLWIPLVDCYRTKSMFVIPRTLDARWRPRVAEFERLGVDALFQALAGDATFLDVPYGHVVIFSHTLMHGNRVNAEQTARWSLNVRFKGLFTPYADKRLGDFFEPLTIRPLTRIGFEHRYPGGFDE